MSHLEWNGKTPEELGPLEDLTPVQRTNRRWWWRMLLVAGLVTLATIGWRLYQQFSPNAPVQYSDIEEHFKYGSIGSEADIGVPYYIWMVMPELCADKLRVKGGGYEAMGFLFEPGKDLPIGTSVRRIFVDRVGFNCALCHVGSVRTTPRESRQLYLGMPSNNLDLDQYIEFFSECARDARFTPEIVMAYIEKRFELGWLESLLYRYVVVDATREGLLKQSSKLRSFWDDQPDWGPGRVDTFNPYKTRQFNFDMSGDESIGTTDFPSIWNQEPRATRDMQLHWDGNNDSMHERNMSAAMGAGVIAPSLDCSGLNRIEAWLRTLPAPRYPFPVDEELVAKGEELYESECARCHAFDGALTGKVTPLTELGTDSKRLNSWSYELVSQFNTLYAGYEGQAGAEECRHVFTRFRKTDGYANPPLDGIWARAPYLHNGSVPTLSALLEPDTERPKKFYRGNDVYDPEYGGFVSDVPGEGPREFFEFDTSENGNSNAGHLYGTKLSSNDKRALVEFLKTL